MVVLPVSHPDEKTTRIERGSRNVGPSPQFELRLELSVVPRVQCVPPLQTGGAVYDHSVYDAARYGNGAGPVKIEDVFRGNLRRPVSSSRWA